MRTRLLTRSEKRDLPWLVDEGTDIVITENGRCFIRSLAQHGHLRIHINTIRMLEKKGYIEWDVGSVSRKHKIGPRMIPGGKIRIVFARYKMGSNWAPGKAFASLRYWLKEGRIPTSV